MPNKLKDIFSDDMFNMSGTLHFSDGEAYKNFLSALEIVYAEGRVVPVEGVTSVSTTVGHLGTKFPLEEQTNITQFLVGPAVEPVPITLDVDGKEKTITENMIKQGAVIIDVGINRKDDGTITGDVDFENVYDKASYITPVPGGVGPMTIAMLMNNVIKACSLKNNK